MYATCKWDSKRYNYPAKRETIVVNESFWDGLGVEIGPCTDFDPHRTPHRCIGGLNPRPRMGPRPGVIRLPSRDVSRDVVWMRHVFPGG